MGRLLIGVVIGFLVAVLLLPEDFQLRENLERAWNGARVFVTELWSDVDDAADQAMEATEETAEEVEPPEEEPVGEAVQEETEAPAEEPAPAEPEPQ